MKSKLTLSIDSELMNEINQKAKLNKKINLSKMVENFLISQFKTSVTKSNGIVGSMRGILKETPETLNWKKDKEERLSSKHLHG